MSDEPDETELAAVAPELDSDEPSPAEEESDEEPPEPPEEAGPGGSSTEAASTSDLSASQRARIERNRQRALLLRQARIQAHPYATDAQGNRFRGPRQEVDTGAGFFIEPTEEDEKTEVKVVHQEAPRVEVDSLLCEQCEKEFMDSFFYTKFDILVCDSCRVMEDKYPMITRTEAKKKYLLKDADFDKREPPLKFILRKNPHNQRWGDMKLYLEPQVKARALQVWGSEEGIEEAKEQRNDTREKSKQKKFDKKVKELRQAVRSSLYKKEKEVHKHEFGPEEYDSDEDMYTKSCKTCSYSQTYEKM